MDKLNQNQILKIIELFNVNISCRKIANMFDVSYTFINRLKHKYFYQS
jgi:transposase